MQDLARSRVSATANLATNRFAKRLQAMVKHGYRNAGYIVEPSTVLRYANPPDTSGEEAVRSKGSLRRTRTLMNSVIAKKRNSSRTRPEWIVTIDPEKRYWNGKPVSEVAWYMEHGYTRKFTVTKNMLSYLKNVLGVHTNWKVGQKIIEKKAARPIWKDVAAKKNTKEVFKRITKDVKHYLDKHAKKVPNK
jgi:hypothetical protein